MSHDNVLTPQHYACLYAWLAGLFARELDERQLARLQEPELATWLDYLSQQAPLAASVAALRQAITALAVRPDARLELAADFAGLFLLSQQRAALPYASCWQGEKARFRQDACEQMQALLHEAGMQVATEFREPEDHLAVFLELLSHLSFADGQQPETAPALQADLYRRTLRLLLGWLPDFTGRCTRHDPFGLYAALSQLLLALVRLDAESGAG